MESAAFLAELRNRAAAAAAAHEPDPAAANAYIPEDEDDPLHFYRARADDAHGELEQARLRLLEAEVNPEAQPAERAQLQRYYDFVQRSEEGLGLKFADIYLQHRGFFGLAPNVVQAINMEVGRYAPLAIRLLEEEGNDEENEHNEEAEGNEEALG